MTAAYLSASRWNRHGDHPKVEVGTSETVPFSVQPEQYGYLRAAQATVVPGDWIVELQDGRLIVLTEREFRKRYEPIPTLETNVA